MSQHDMNIANDTGAAVRADINNALGALVSCSSGTSAPSTTFAYMLWADTTNALLKMRNGANTSWITVGTLDVANLGLSGAAGLFTTLASTSTVTEGTYTIRKTVSKTGITDNTATDIFTITTTDEAGTSDGGAYSCFVRGVIGHDATSTGAPDASKAFFGAFTHVIAGNGSPTTSAVTEIYESASAANDPPTKDIGTVTMTVVATSTFVRTVQFQVDLTGTSVGSAEVTLSVELVYTGFLTAPAIAAA